MEYTEQSRGICHAKQLLMPSAKCGWDLSDLHLAEFLDHPGEYAL